MATDYMRKAREHFERIGLCPPQKEGLKEFATTLEALDKAEADSRTWQDRHDYQQERAVKAEAERDALRGFVTVFVSDPCACGIAINKPCLQCKARALIQPEPDPLEELAKAICRADPDIRMGDADAVVEQRVQAEWRNYIWQAKAALSHGLAAKEVG